MFEGLIRRKRSPERITVERVREGEGEHVIGDARHGGALEGDGKLEEPLYLRGSSPDFTEGPRRGSGRHRRRRRWRSAARGRCSRLATTLTPGVSASTTNCVGSPSTSAATTKNPASAGRFGRSLLAREHEVVAPADRRERDTSGSPEVPRFGQAPGGRGLTGEQGRADSAPSAALCRYSDSAAAAMFVGRSGPGDTQFPMTSATRLRSMKTVARDAATTVLLGHQERGPAELGALPPPARMDSPPVPSRPTPAPSRVDRCSR